MKKTSFLTPRTIQILISFSTASAYILIFFIILYWVNDNYTIRKRRKPYSKMDVFERGYSQNK